MLLLKDIVVNGKHTNYHFKSALKKEDLLFTVLDTETGENYECRELRNVFGMFVDHQFKHIVFVTISDMLWKLTYHINTDKVYCVPLSGGLWEIKFDGFTVLYNDYTLIIQLKDYYEIDNCGLIYLSDLDNSIKTLLGFMLDIVPKVNLKKYSKLYVSIEDDSNNTIYEIGFLDGLSLFLTKAVCLRKDIF